jgi:hypothetical protein
MSLEIPVSKRLYEELEKRGKELGLTPEQFLSRIVRTVEAAQQGKGAVQ